MLQLWRVALSALAVAAAFLLVRPVSEMLLNAVRARMPKRYRCAVFRRPTGL